MSNFTTPCFIRKNTPELRAKLEEMGYRNYGNPFQPNNKNYIFTTFYGVYEPYFITVDNRWYDCGENEELFLALAGLRSDSKETAEELIKRFADGKD